MYDGAQIRYAAFEYMFSRAGINIFPLAKTRRERERKKRNAREALACRVCREKHHFRMSISMIVTCRDDLVDTGHLLLADHVPAPARERAVVPLGLRGVHELAHGAVVAVELGRRDLEVLAAVVELPDEVDLAGIGVHLAAHLHGLLQGCADHRHLLRFADRRDLREREGEDA